MTTRRRRAIARKIQSLLGKGRESYNAADRLLDELRAGTPVGAVIDAKEAGLFRLVDNFATVNVAFKTASVKRYELKPLNKTEAAEYREAQLPKQAELIS